jgi:hypothetical protein
MTVAIASAVAVVLRCRAEHSEAHRHSSIGTSATNLALSRSRADEIPPLAKQVRQPRPVPVPELFPGRPMQTNAHVVCPSERTPVSSFVKLV